MNLNDVTVILPTKNEHDNIGRFLQSLPNSVKLIVIDASTDDTRDIITQQRPNNTEVVFHLGNIASARQKGVETAQTKWLLHTDADMIFADNYFDELKKIKVNNKVGGIMGAKQSLDRYVIYYYLFSLSLRLSSYLQCPAASGSNMLTRRQAVYGAGGFDEELSCNEDSYLMMQIRRNGWRVHYQGNLIVYELDHRRLDQGVLRKTLHSIIRNLLIALGLFSKKLRESDWGYWQKKEQ